MGSSTYPAPIANSANLLEEGSEVSVAGYGAYSEDDRMLRPLVS